MIAFTRRALFLLLLVAAQAAAAADPSILFSYEAVPSAQIDLPRAKQAAYADKETLARAVARELVPEILVAVGLDPKKAKTEIAPGGYELQVNPALQTVMPASIKEADRLAAALGYVLRQGSVLVSDRAGKNGDTLMVIVVFAPRMLTPSTARSFYLHAAAADRGLAGGFSVLGQEMLFINLRGADGKPYGGLDDQSFHQAMKRAAAVYTGASVAGARKIRSYLVENDWDKARDGEDYAKRLGGDLFALDELRQRHTTMVLAAARLYDWR